MSSCQPAKSSAHSSVLPRVDRQIGTPDRQIGKTGALARFGPEVEEVPGLAGPPRASAPARKHRPQKPRCRPPVAHRSIPSQLPCRTGKTREKITGLCKISVAINPLGPFRALRQGNGREDQTQSRMRTSQPAILSISLCRTSPGFTWLTPEQVPLMMMSPGHKV